jgi:hypothetical protein
MTDGASLQEWAEGLGLTIDAAGEQAAGTIVMAREGAPRVEIIRRGASDREIGHKRRLRASDVAREWGAPEGASGSADVHTLGPTDLLARTLHQMTLAYPLVRAHLRTDGESVELEFTAPLFMEGLTRQSFALTVCGLLNAVETFDVLCAARAEQRAELERLTSSLTIEGIDAAIEKTTAAHRTSA